MCRYREQEEREARGKTRDFCETRFVARGCKRQRWLTRFVARGCKRQRWLTP